MCLPLDQLPTKELEEDLISYRQWMNAESHDVIKRYWEQTINEIEGVLKDRAERGTLLE